ncbi:MAG: hypothetical protein AAFO58_10110, partial [Pseudomonadota bacterium]
MNAIRVSAASTLIILSATATLRADVTAQDVWADWQSYLSAVGYTVTGEESTRLGQVTITNLVMEAPSTVDGETTNFVVNMPRLVFTENGDGSVNVQIPERSTLQVEANDGQEAFQAEFLFEHTDMVMNVSGDADDMTHTYSADAITFSPSDLAINGDPIGSENASGSMTVSDIEGVTRMQLETLRTYAQTINAGTTGFDMFFVDPENADTTAKINVALETLAMSAQTT